MRIIIDINSTKPSARSRAPSLTRRAFQRSSSRPAGGAQTPVESFWICRIHQDVQGHTLDSAESFEESG
eukprot:49858-Pyramimonas_sp.AAC.1